MSINQDGLINFVVNGIIVLTIELFYKFFMKRYEKTDKYIKKNDINCAIINFIDSFIEFIPWMLILWLVHSFWQGALNERYKEWLFIGLAVLTFSFIKWFANFWKAHFQLWLLKEPIGVFGKLVELYEEDEVFQRYFLKQESVRLVRITKILEWIHITFILGSYDAHEALQISIVVALYPVFMLFLLNDINTIFNGYTLEEYCEKELKSDSEKVKIPHVAIIGDLIAQYVGDFKLWSESKVNNEKTDLLELKEEGYEYDLFRGFLESYQKNYTNDHKLNYLIVPTVEVLKKQNVIFHTFFYRDLELAVCYPMMLSAYRGRKNLIIIDNAVVEDEIKWIESSIEKLSGIYDFIKCRDILAATERDDIIIMNYNQFLNWRESLLLEKIAGRIDMIFMVEPSTRNLQDVAEVSCLKTYIEENGGSVNIVIADSHQEIVEKMMWISDWDTVYKGPYRLMPKESTVILLNADLECKKDGINSELEAKIIHMLQEKAHQNEVIWVDQNVRPSIDLWWLYQKNRSVVNKIEVHHLENGRKLEAKKEGYYIIEDAEFNYLAVKERFLSRAEEKGVIFILEPNYLLRDYLIKNKDISKEVRDFVKNKIGIDFQITERNQCMSLINELYIEVDKFKQNMEEAEQLVKKYFPGLKIEVKHKGEITDNNTYNINEFVERQKDMIICREEKIIKVWNGMNYNMVFQKHLPGQSIVVGGIRYIFTAIEKKDKQYCMLVRRNLDKTGKREYYRQKREYVLRESVKKNSFLIPERHINNIHLKWECMQVFCKTSGYRKMSAFHDFMDSIDVYTDGIPIRDYDQKQVLHISIPNIDYVELMFFSILLKEMLYTLCSDTIDYLGIGISCSEYKNPIVEKYIDAGIIWEMYCDEDGIYILEDSIQDIGVVSAIEQQMDTVVELMIDYINWCVETHDSYLPLRFQLNQDEVEGCLIRLKDAIQEMKDETSYEETVQEVVEEKNNEEIKDETEDRQKNDSKPTKIENSLSKEEAEKIFTEVLAGMLYFRDLNIGSNWKLKTSNEDSKDREKSTIIQVSLNMSREAFYEKCALEIIRKYNEINRMQMDDEQCKELAKDYVKILFEINMTLS